MDNSVIRMLSPSEIDAVAGGASGPIATGLGNLLGKLDTALLQGLTSGLIDEVDAVIGGGINSLTSGLGGALKGLTGSLQIP